MEEFSLPAETLSPVLSDVPEALQVPTKHMSHSYLALYATGAVIAVLGILSVIPIRSVS